MTRNNQCEKLIDSSKGMHFRFSNASLDLGLTIHRSTQVITGQLCIFKKNLHRTCVAVT